MFYSSFNFIVYMNSSLSVSTPYFEQWIYGHFFKNSDTINIAYYYNRLNPPSPPSIHYGTPSNLHLQTYQSSFGWFLN